MQGKGKQNPVECISFLCSSIFLTFNQSFVCLAFISFTAVNLDAVEKREPGGVLRSDGCPKPGRFGLCAELCGVGGGCSGGKICCSNGCGHQCMSRCPKPGPFGLCAELCGVGGGCSGGKICCFNGCGHQCMSPGKY